MNDLLDITLLVLGLLAAMSGLLYVLAVLDPQTEGSARTHQVTVTPGQLSSTA